MAELEPAEELALPEGFDSPKQTIFLSSSPNIREQYSPLERYQEALNSIVRLSDIIGPEECKRLAEHDRMVEAASRRARVERYRRRRGY